MCLKNKGYYNAFSNRRSGTSYCADFQNIALAASAAGAAIYALVADELPADGRRTAGLDGLAILGGTSHGGQPAGVHAGNRGNCVSSRWLVPWFLLRDVVAGIIFKLQHTLKLNQSIRVVDTSGRLLRLGITALVLENASGEQIKIPYTKLINETVARNEASDVIEPFDFSLQVPNH